MQLSYEHEMESVAKARGLLKSNADGDSSTLCPSSRVCLVVKSQAVEKLKIVSVKADMPIEHEAGEGCAGRKRRRYGEREGEKVNSRGFSPHLI